MNSAGVTRAGAVIPDAEHTASLGYHSYVLFVLVIVYAFNFIDRQIVGILAVPIKAELLGTTLIGLVSDSMRVRFGVESLRYAILAGTGFYLMAATLLFFAGRRLAKDWV